MADLDNIILSSYNTNGGGQEKGRGLGCGYGSGHGWGSLIGEECGYGHGLSGMFRFGFSMMKICTELSCIIAGTGAGRRTKRQSAFCPNCQTKHRTEHRTRFPAFAPLFVAMFDMFQQIYKGVYINCHTSECNFRNMFTNKQEHCTSIKSAKNQITRMLKRG